MQNFLKSIFFLLLFCPTAYAQSFEGLVLGQKADAIEKLGNPADSTTDAEGYQYRRYILSDGNALLTTIDKNGTVVFLEKDWESSKPDQKSGFNSFIFGKTTILDALLAFGHNGRIANDNFPMQTMPNGNLAFFLPYDLEKNDGIAIFIFLIKEGDFLSIDLSSDDLFPQISKAAKLDSIMVSTMPVFSKFWPHEIIGTKGKPIKWQTATK